MNVSQSKWWRAVIASSELAQEVRVVLANLTPMISAAGELHVAADELLSLGSAVGKRPRKTHAPVVGVLTEDARMARFYSCTVCGGGVELVEGVQQCSCGATYRAEWNGAWSVELVSTSFGR